MLKPFCAHKTLKAASGYGLAMLMMFIASSLMIATSLQLVAGPVGLAYLGGASQNSLSARQIAEIGIAAAKTDIQSKLNALQTVTTSYTLSNSINMPGDPANPGNLNSSLGSYTASITYARGNLYVLKVIGSVGGTSEILYELLNLGISHQKPLDYASGATAAYGLRKLRSAYSGSAIRVRRSSDNTEQDIGFLPDGSLDLYSLKSFLGTALPVDSVSGSVGAFSLRKLRAAYTGAAIRVRRSSDSTSLDIGFNPSGDLDVATLMNFVGNDTGYVTTWYDQSGSGNNASQTTAGNQPAIVESGVLQTVNGRPAVHFTTDDLSLSNIVPDNMTLLGVYSHTSSSGDATASTVARHAYNMSRVFNADSGGYGKNDYCIAVDTNGYPTGTVGNGDSTIDSSVYAAPTNTVNDGRLHWIAFTRDKTTSQFSIFGDRGSYSRTNGNTATLNANSSLYIGYGLDGYVSEAIFYSSVLSTANLQALQQDESRYWTVPTQNYVAPPVDTVTGATAAYGLRKLRSAYSGPAIRVRRSSDNAEQDIGFATNGGLDDVTLKTFVGNNTGYVTTWYDQMGSSTPASNTLRAEQASTSLQPIIVNAGTVETINNRPAIYFLATTLATASSATWPSGSADRTLNAVYKFTTTTNTIQSLVGWGTNSAGTSSRLLKSDATLGFYGHTESIYGTYGLDTTTVHALTATHNTGTVNVYSDGTLSNTGAVTLNTAANTSLQLGRFGGTNTYNGHLSEVVIYSSALSDTNRAILERNQLQYYAPPNTTAYVTTWYDQSGNGNHATQTNYSLQPSLRFESDGGNKSAPTLVFDGNNAGQNFGQWLSTTGGFPTNANYSLSAVFSYRNAGFANNILSSAVDASGAHAFFLESSNNLKLWHWGSFVTSSTALSINKQYAVLGTFVNSSKAGALYLYNTSAGTGTAANSNTASTIQLGSHLNNNPFKGTLSEAIVFNKVLSTAERTALYQSQVATYGAL